MLQASLEKRKETLHERRLALEEDVCINLRWHAVGIYISIEFKN